MSKISTRERAHTQININIYLLFSTVEMLLICDVEVGALSSCSEETENLLMLEF